VGPLKPLGWGRPRHIEALGGMYVGRLMRHSVLYTAMSLVALLILLQESMSADPNSPHRHTGMLEVLAASAFTPITNLRIGTFLSPCVASHSPRQPYQPKAPTVQLDSAALGKLAKGQPVSGLHTHTRPNQHVHQRAGVVAGRQVKFQINEGKKGGRGMVIQDVHAPVDMVVDRILDFSAYPRMVTAVTECGNYQVNKLGKVRIALMYPGWDASL
jgi:hypothetical protein